MTDEAASSGPQTSETGDLTTSDGTPLAVSLHRAEKRARRNAFLLVVPLLAFLVVTFVLPIAEMITRSVQNYEVADYLPNTTEAIAEWDGQELPPEAVFAAMARDIELGAEDRTIGRVAARINREIPGTRSQMMRLSRDIDEMDPPYREKFLADDEGWGNLDFWRLIKRETRTITPLYYLLAFDFEYDNHGAIVERAEEYQVYRQMFWRTAWMSVLITCLCILLGYPVAYLLATLPLRYSNLLMILVLLPFWTSLLVRTSAWIVLLQQQGVVNDILVWFDVISDDGRFRMIYNQIGTIVAMTHILLPFMILPLYSVMKTVPPSYMRAARSLGANPVHAFVTIYMPLTIPGLAAGVLLVFILAIGYYITPALVGGDTGIFISNLIARNMQGSGAELKLALALSTVLLVAVLIIYWLFNKLVGVDRLKFG